MEKPITSEIEFKRAEVEKFLANRGIDQIEIGEVELVETNALDLIDNTNPEKSEKIRQETIVNLEELGLDPNASIIIEKRIIKFSEDVTKGVMAETFPYRESEQELTLYVYKTSQAKDANKVSVAVFSHGGGIRPNTSMKSPFLAEILALAEKEEVPLLLGTVNHRGSDPDTKPYYSLEDRKNDLALTHLAMLSEEILGDRRAMVTHIGNSMGGNVVAEASYELRPNQVILPQPAAYSKSAQTVPLGPQFSEAIREVDGWKKSPAFDALESYLRNGGRALIIGAQEDEVIPGSLVRRYMKEVTNAFYERLFKAKGKIDPSDTLWIPVSHTSTTPGELTAIVNRLKIRQL